MSSGEILKRLIDNTKLSKNELKQKIMKTLLLHNDMLKVKQMTEKILSGDVEFLKEEDRKELISVLSDEPISLDIPVVAPKAVPAKSKTLKPVKKETIEDQKLITMKKELDKLKAALVEKEKENQKLKQLVELTTIQQPITVSDEDINKLYLSLLSSKNTKEEGSAFALDYKNKYIIPKSYYKVERIGG